jgi:hypothetical protein
VSLTSVDHRLHTSKSITSTHQLTPLKPLPPSGHLWTAKWWTEADTPGGAAGVWTDNGACSSLAAATANAKGPVAATANTHVEASATATADLKGTVVGQVAPGAASASAAIETAKEVKGQAETQKRRISRFFRDRD